jgi:hypothetical protein
MVIRALAVVAGTTALLVSAAQVSAQTPDPNESPDLERPRVYRTTGARVAIGRSIRIAADEEVTDAVVVVGGSLRIDGRVRDGVVVIGGDVDLGPQSDVRGDVVLVGGRLTRASGAQLRGSVSDVSFGDWGTWSWGGFTVPRVRFGEFGGWLSLFGAMFRISLLAILMAIVLLVARAPVARVGQAAAAEPGPVRARVDHRVHRVDRHDHRHSAGGAARARLAASGVRGVHARLHRPCVPPR